VICRFCGHDKKLVKAHIIPEGFFRSLRQGKDMPRLLSSSRHAHPKKIPIGVYDTEILCETCERLFQHWDQYGQEFFARKHRDWKPLSIHGHRIYEIHDYDYASLKLFFVSILWRASVSGQDFFKRVNLGPLEDTAKRLIAEATPGSADDFSVLLAVFDAPVANPFLSPALLAWAQIRHYRFYLGSYVAYIKADDGRTPKPLHDFILKETPPLYVFCRNLRGSVELPLMKKMAEANRGLVQRMNPANNT
jgi:hypothetical protein